MLQQKANKSESVLKTYTLLTIASIGANTRVIPDQYVTKLQLVLYIYYIAKFC